MEFPIAGTYSGKLSNTGDRLILVNHLQQVIASIKYSDNGELARPAPTAGGSSLQIKDTSIAENDPDNWRASVEYGGTPGRDGLSSYNDVVINEVLTHTDPPYSDTIELYKHHRPCHRHRRLVFERFRRRL